MEEKDKKKSIMPVLRDMKIRLLNHRSGIIIKITVQGTEIN